MSKRKHNEKGNPTDIKPSKLPKGNEKAPPLARYMHSVVAFSKLNQLSVFGTSINLNSVISVSSSILGSPELSISGRITNIDFNTEVVELVYTHSPPSQPTETIVSFELVHFSLLGMIVRSRNSLTAPPPEDSSAMDRIQIRSILLDVVHQQRRYENVNTTSHRNEGGLALLETFHRDGLLKDCTDLSSNETIALFIQRWCIKFGNTYGSRLNCCDEIAAGFLKSILITSTLIESSNLLHQIHQ